MLRDNFDRLRVLAVAREEEEKEKSDEKGVGRERAVRAEALGDARLAWAWVEGWEARLRRGAEVVELARREAATVVVVAGSSGGATVVPGMIL